MVAVPARFVMQAIMSAVQGVNYLCWHFIPHFVPAVMLQENFADAKIGALLSAFQVGYVWLQIPASLAARRVGEKLLMSCDLLGNAAILFAMPAATRRFGFPALFAGIAGLGLFQSPRVPCLVGMKSRWQAAGIERVWTDIINGWSMSVFTVLASALTPRLATRGKYGWHSVCYCYGTANLVVLVTMKWWRNWPSEWPGISGEEKALLDANFGTSSSRRDCHFDDTPFSPLLKRLLKVEGGAQQNDSLADV